MLKWQIKKESENQFKIYPCCVCSRRQEQNTWVDTETSSMDQMFQNTEKNKIIDKKMGFFRGFIWFITILTLREGSQAINLCIRVFIVFLFTEPKSANFTEHNMHFSTIYLHILKLHKSWTQIKTQFSYNNDYSGTGQLCKLNWIRGPQSRPGLDF